MSGASLLPGDIVLIIHTPRDDPSAVKARPAFVVSGAQFNKTGPDVIVAPISSNVRYGDATQVVVQSNDPHFGPTGLKQTSAVKCGAIFAYSRAQIRRKIGVAHSETISRVRGVIMDILTSD
jgi:mRNA-degrading endonuclease toxin of MazEF toxin-antitoxin module